MARAARSSAWAATTAAPASLETVRVLSLDDAIA